MADNLYLTIFKTNAVQNMTSVASISKTKADNALQAGIVVRSDRDIGDCALAWFDIDEKMDIKSLPQYIVCV